MTNQGKKVQDYRRLIEISRDLASTLDLETLLERIVHVAAEITNAAAASILLYDDAARQLNFEVTTNLDMQTMRGLNIPLEGSVAGWVISNRQTVRLTDAHKDARFYAEVERKTKFPTHSMLGVPLITKDKVVGVLEVINKPRGGFTPTDEDLLLVLGAQAAVAIENARLFQQSDLVAEFVHELRTPLASIGNATYLLLRPEMSPEQREQIIRNIHGETIRLNTLASSFLDLARLESGRVLFHRSKFALTPLLQECFQIMQGKADENRIHLTLEAPADFPEVEADRDKIKQVVLNLLSNGIKYNFPDGKVQVRVEQNGDHWTLTVRDSGFGIPAEAIPHLFQKFFRVHSYEQKVPGTGLGLSICKQIVLRHGGSISVDTKMGEGTAFTIHMPWTRPGI